LLLLYKKERKGFFVKSDDYDIIVIGAGAAGMFAAITAARQGKRVLVLEKLPKIGTKLKATGGGRCNLTNTLESERFMESFGREGRFMRSALHAFDHHALVAFLEEIGVKSHAPDGFRIFPVTHKATTIIEALEREMSRLGIAVLCGCRVDRLLDEAMQVRGVKLDDGRSFHAQKVIVATGGKGYPQLGAEGDGYRLASAVGHTISELYPAMMPLKVKETWVASCRADTLPKVTLRVDMKKYRKYQATGDLIFTKDGIRGPVVLDFSREITPLLHRYEEVPLVANFTKGMNEEQIRTLFNEIRQKEPHLTTLALVEHLLPHSVASALCALAKVVPDKGFKKQTGKARERLIQLLAWTPLTVTGHDGFKMAMITRGGVKLKEIEPRTMESRKVQGLYFCGEVLDLDGPCGGYNLQWSFSSGYLAGLSAAL